MFSTKTLALLLTATAANAAILDLFSDQGCATPAGSRNVYDNSCISLPLHTCVLLSSAVHVGSAVLPKILRDRPTEVCCLEHCNRLWRRYLTHSNTDMFRLQAPVGGRQS